METLKLTSLAIFILFGLLLSDTAAAYPEPLDQIDYTDTTCAFRMVSPPKPPEQNDKPPALSQVVVDLIAPIDTPPLDQDRQFHADTCRLDLDLIEAE